MNYSRVLVILADSLNQLAFIACILILDLSDTEIAAFYTFIASYGLAHLITDSGFLTRSMKLYGSTGEWEMHPLFHLIVGLVLYVVGISLDLPNMQIIVLVGLILTFNTHFFNALRFRDRNIEYLALKSFSTLTFLIGAHFRTELDVSLDFCFGLSQMLVLILLVFRSSVLFRLDTTRFEIYESLVISSNSYTGWVRNGLDKFILAETVTVATLATYSIVQQFLVIYQFIGAAISKLIVVSYFNSEIGLRKYREIWRYHIIHIFIFISILLYTQYLNINGTILMLLSFSVLIGNLNSLETPLLFRSAQKGYMFFIFSLSTLSYLFTVSLYSNLTGVLYASNFSVLSVYLFNLYQWKRRKYRY